jgi:hypothetical protein
MANLSFVDIFRRRFAHHFEQNLADEAKLTTARGVSDTKSHYLLYSEKNLVEQLVPFFGREQAKEVAKEKTETFLELVTSKEKKNPRLAAALSQFAGGKGLFRLLLTSEDVTQENIYNYIYRTYLLKGMELSESTWKLALLKNWLKDNGKTLDQYLIGNGDPDGGVLNEYLINKDDDIDPTTIDTSKLATRLRDRLEERYAPNEDILGANYFSKDNLRRQINNLKKKLGKQSAARASFEKLSAREQLDTAGLLLSIIYLLGDDPGAKAILAVKGGLNLGHVVSIRTEEIGKAIIGGIAAGVGVNLPADAVVLAETKLNFILVKMFDDPSISVDEIYDGVDYEKAVIAENAELNKGAKASLLKNLATDLSKGQAASQRNKFLLLKALTRFTNSLNEEIFSDLRKELDRLDWSQMLTSPSYINRLETIIDEVWETGKSKPFRNKETKKAKVHLRPNIKAPKIRKSGRAVIPSQLNKLPKAKLAPLAPPAKKQTKQSFLNLTKIKLYVNSHLHDTMQEKMKGQRLHYRTGRLARSAQVVNIQQTRKNTIALYYTYMKNPYATFAKGGKQHTPRRDVDNLIMASARSLAREVVANKFKLSVRGT